MRDRNKLTVAVKSPCVNICEMNDEGFCAGCLRTVAEIKAWKNSSEREKLSILAKVRARKEIGV